MANLTLISNPGSASRKYALYDGEKCLAKLHFEVIDRQIICTLKRPGQEPLKLEENLSHLTFAGSQLSEILTANNLIGANDNVKRIALRTVAPSAYFQQDRLLSKDGLKRLKDLEPEASIHVHASLQEANILATEFPQATLVAISDSAFHAGKPDRAKYYSIPLDDAKKLGIVRYGYHGLSAESVVSQFGEDIKLPTRTIIAHLGGGASLTALQNGQSIDNTMGYSPLEGLVMATRSGDIDATAVEALRRSLKLDAQQFADYLNDRSGLLGVSGASSDIPILLKLEAEGHQGAKLALELYVYHVAQAVGRMTVALGGLDALVFTGTVGERSAEIRRRVIKQLHFLGLELNPHLNHQTLAPAELTQLGTSRHPVKIYVAPANEDLVMAKHALKVTE